MLKPGRIVAVALILSSAALAAQQTPPPWQAPPDPSDKLQTLPDFKIERVLAADPKVQGSWINMARDPKGRLLLTGQRGQPTTRLTITDGKIEKEEQLKLPVTEIMGLLFAFDALYVNGAGPDSTGKQTFGLFRLKDTKNDGQYDQVDFLREWKGGAGEHGAHGIVAGPDKKLYIVCGNFVDLPKDLLPSSPHRNYADDRVLPRAEDGNGFGAGRKPPGGYVVRVDPDGKNAELFASGERNTYDIAFNADGELFGFDSDMEWDWGTPWYRPVRVFHAASGADHGFREGTAKWPDHYADSLPSTVTIGIGCPTGVIFGYGARFPEKYQRAFYVLDWSYGRLIAVHLAPKGATYGGSWENFVAPKGLTGNGPKVPLNLTDAVIGEDGSLYFTVGGRGTQAQLFRVSYTGGAGKALVDGKDKDGADARARRHALEAWQTKEDPAAVDASRKALGDPDRAIRYAARVALERQPVDSWKAAALAETQPQAAFGGLLALARLGSSDAQPDVYKSLLKFPASGLEEGLLLDKLRVIEVSIARHGKPSDGASAALIADLGSLYPAKSPALNLELCQVLLALEAPDAVAKTLKLLEAAATQEEQLAYVLHLRGAKVGWTPEFRKSYFSWWTLDRNKAGHPAEVKKWFEEAGRGYSDGASLPKFIGNFHTQARAGLSPEESTALAEVLAAYIPPGQKPRKPLKARPFVKEWKMEDLLPSLADVAKDRNYERAKEAYEATQCLACHKFGNEGGSVGPELTAIATRFARKDILEAIIEPSKVISEQFQSTMFLTKDGRVLDGRVLEENAEKVVIQPNMLQPEKVTIKKADIDKRQPSKTSPMPPSLVNVLTKDEILDMVAYLEAGGRKEHPFFASTKLQVDVTDKVAAAVKDNSLKISAGNGTFGDPAPNQVKRLRVDYLEGDTSRSKVIDENETLEINPPEGRKLVIKRAIYGVIP